MKIIGKQESAGGFPCGFLFSGLFPPFPKFWEGGIKGGWVSNYMDILYPGRYNFLPGYVD